MTLDSRAAPLLLCYVHALSYTTCVISLQIRQPSLPPIDIRDVLDVTAPDMSGINLRNLLLNRGDEGTLKNVPASSQLIQRKRARGENSAGPSRPVIPTPPPIPLVQETPGGDSSVPLRAPQLEYYGGDAMTEADCILPVGDGRSAAVASAISQAAYPPLDMGKWKKSLDDELIKNLRRGLLMGVQASLELEDRFRANKEHLAHANSLATRYQDTKKKAIEAKKLADAANAKKVEAEESFKAALESLTKAEDKIWAYESDFKQQAKRYEAGSKKAQNEMNCHLPGVCNEFYTDGWHVAVGTDVVDLEDAEVTSILVVKEPVGAGLPQDDPAPTAEGGSTAPLDPDFANL
uniref:Uncharacterized protein n=1 Tax=Fagus sylvatica TaxID=28930 RepID=A0A2N9FBG3_FAGSY